jgi:hypothetical protein
MARRTKITKEITLTGDQTVIKHIATTVEAAGKLLKYWELPPPLSQLYGFYVANISRLLLQENLDKWTKGRLSEFYDHEGLVEDMVDLTWAVMKLASMINDYRAAAGMKRIVFTQEAAKLEQKRKLNGQ